jgi:hypothetical protein
VALLAIACGRAVPAFAGDAAPAPSGQHQAGSAASRPATAPARPASAAPKKVWTAEDLARLRQTSRAPITVAAVPTPEIPSATTTQAADPGVVKRLQEVLGESDAALQRLDRERLASLNPFMRGLSRDPQGKPVAPRPVAEIEAEREQWVSRQAVAKATLERLARAANRPPEEYLPTAPDPADPGAPAAPKP